MPFRKLLRDWDARDFTRNRVNAAPIRIFFHFFPIRASAYEPNSSSKTEIFDQVAGHLDAFSVDRDGKLLKTVDENEKNFYDAAQGGAWPLKFLPGYYGTSPSGDTILIENITRGYQNPCIMDLKIGVRTCGEDSNWRKYIRMSLLDLATRSSTTGVRLEGLTLHRARENVVLRGGKHAAHLCSLLTPLRRILTLFLTDVQVRTDVARVLLRKVEALIAAFQSNTDFRFIGTSLLLVYDSDGHLARYRWLRALQKIGLESRSLAKLSIHTRADLRMIDFAHVEEATVSSGDDNFITGLVSIKKALISIIAEEKSTSRYRFSEVANDLILRRELGNQLHVCQ